VSNFAKQFALVFLFGFAIMVFALGYGGITNDIFSELPLLVALRALGAGLMASGMTLWVAARRDEAGKPELNPLLYFLAVSGTLVLIVAAAANMQPFMPLLTQVGIGLTLGGMLLALIIMAFMPAFPKPFTSTWPEGGEPESSPPSDHAHEHEQVSAPHTGHAPASTGTGKADDLTRIEGIGPKLQQILRDAGVMTYADLAAQSPDAITGMIREAGFKAPFDAATWPRQAQLAAQGDWDALARLQSDLNAGRKR